ncbi:MAG: carboxylesterase family protein [Rhodospirillales bacterium]|nr:carboxylesterase family protein [Rhodospirillales bacterium]
MMAKIASISTTRKIACTTDDVVRRPSDTEDCLYLNVTAPRGWPTRGSWFGLRPVMVWIHGGGLTSGQGDDYGATRLAVDGDVIVVTLNYRLGALGFLAVVSGWIVAEVGRQPFTVYGVLRTAESVAPVTAAQVATSLLVFMIVYAIIFTAGAVYIARIAVRGFDDAPAGSPDEEHRAPGTPMGAVRDLSGRESFSYRSTAITSTPRRWNAMMTSLPSSPAATC